MVELIVKSYHFATVLCNYVLADLLDVIRGKIEELDCFVLFH